MTQYKDGSAGDVLVVLLIISVGLVSILVPLYIAVHFIAKFW